MSAEEADEEARRLVGRLWPEIQAFAAALMDKKTLSRDEAEEVFEAASSVSC